MPMTYTDRRHFANLIMEFANGRFFHGSSIVNSLLCPVGGPLSLSPSLPIGKGGCEKDGNWKR